MSHQTFKVSIVIDDSVENFYIKHYVDDFQPIFNKFKNLVFQRNPFVNLPNLKIYWIDAENDKILISCEEDFRLYIEQGKGKKIFFSVIKGPIQQQEEEDETMEAEESCDRHKADRKSRKSTRDEEKQKRASKRLAEKMRSAEEKLRCEAERHSRCSDKYERKNAERLERAKKRCDQIRQIIGSSLGSFDPANLSFGQENLSNSGAATSSDAGPIPPAVNQALDIVNATPEIIRLVSNAVLTGCLQPANLINKLLTEIIGMIPPVPTEYSEQGTSGQSTSGQASQSSSGNDQQQQTEVPRQHMATNTSDMTSPIAGHPANEEIRALFKEAAKELEKINEIANSSKTMESSTISAGSAGSSSSVITQIERVVKNLTDSTISNATVVNVDPKEANVNPPEVETVDARAISPEIEESFKIVTPPKSLLRSRESSIEVHDVNSMMSDDSRDWTMLDAATNEHDEEASFMSAFNRSLPATSPTKETETSIESGKNSDSIKSISTETQTQSSSLSHDQLRASLQKSLEAVGEMRDMVKNSVAMSQKTLDDVQEPEEGIRVYPYNPSINLIDSERKATSVASQAAPVSSSVGSQAVNVTEAKPSAPPIDEARQIWPPVSFSSSIASTQANLKAQSSTETKPKVQSEPAVVVYDPNPKINAAVHTMLAMGFSNDGGWLTQLLLNVDGDVPSAINFLTPQPKNKQK